MAYETLLQVALWTLQLSQHPLFCALPGARVLEMVLASLGLVEPPLEPGRVRIRWYSVR